jgi:predicted metal-dependent peptidase
MINLQNLTPKELIIRAKSRMYKSSPFFAYIVLRMKVIEDKKNKFLPKQTNTMGIDYKGNLHYNPKWVKQLDETELIGVIAHEALHIALLHMLRGQGKNRLVLNMANDLVVNDILLEDHFNLPEGGLIPDRYNHSFTIPKLNITIEKINEKCSEEIYDELMKKLPKRFKRQYSKESGGNMGGLSKDELDKIKDALQTLDHHIYIVGKDKEREGSVSGRLKTTQAQNWKKIVANAVEFAKSRGKLPSGIARRVDDLLDSKINWKTKLYKYIIKQIPFDFTWSKPSKRSLSTGYYLPSVVRESVKIIAHIDTSGSISKDELKEFLSELLTIGNAFPNINIKLIICDAEIQETYDLNQNTIREIVKLPISGGGGTSHVPVYEYIEKEIPDAKVLVSFTDGYTEFPNHENGFRFDTLWVLTKNSVPANHIPFGEVIKLD